MAVLFVLSALHSCRPDVKEERTAQKYFDLKGFFKSDSTRLSSMNPLINKTVIQNGVSQTQQVHIANWGRELAQFSNSDINKPAWRSSYYINSGNGITIYTAREPGLKTRSIMIKRVNNRLKWLVIFNHTKNMLFEDTEKLSYFPDSLYRIAKEQQVLFLGKNKYSVKGFFGGQ